MSPAGLLRHPKDVFREIFLRVFRIRILVCFQLGMEAIEGVGYVFQKDEAKRHMLVF